MPHCLHNASDVQVKQKQKKYRKQTNKIFKNLLIFTIWDLKKIKLGLNGFGSSKYAMIKIYFKFIKSIQKLKKNPILS